MPLRGGHLTPSELIVARTMAATGSVAAARDASRMSLRGVQQAVARPAVQAEVIRIQVERLATEALPAAVDCLVSIITNANAPAGARVQASKAVMDRVLGGEDASKTKAPSEMNGEELARAIAELERIASDRAKVVNVPDAIPDTLEQVLDSIDDEPEDGIFG